MDQLRISENGRYLEHQDGTPFIFLADTAWTVPARLKWDDVQHYMKVRKSQGFTVLQMVVLDPEHNPGMQNPCGIPALKGGDLLSPNEAYFSYVDWVLDQAEAFGFYVLLLPVWGELVVGWDWSGGTHPKTVTEANAFACGKWLGARMRHRRNLLWCLGGDRMPVTRGTDYRPVWRNMAEGLSEGLTGTRLSYSKDHEAWKKLLFTYHACHEAETGECSTFSYWTPEDAWIGFTMLQSGHGAFKKNYELIRAERQPKMLPSPAPADSPEADRSRIYPVWDGEPAYEMMPMTWPVEDMNAFHGTYIVRKRAYWALLAGAFGHTYGHASVWCTATEKDKNMICRYTWAEAIRSEGSGQMKILRDFMEAFPLHAVVPCQERLLRQSAGEDELDLHEQAAVLREEGLMLVYFASGTEERIDACDLYPENVHAAWFDPKSGSLTATEELRPEISDGRKVYRVKNDAPDGEDRVLILAADPGRIAVPAGAYGEEVTAGDVQKVFEW